MDDLMSSPDPLGDNIPPPSSAHSHARRTENTLPPHDFSSISVPRSTARRTSPSKQSPRKQTFELDVGNDLSPQKILVTVEAEEALKRGINRRLFQSSSPIRGDRRMETITTTTVPLNDEIENESTPRRRGRPRRVSNGTPMPRGKKRAGTPIQKSSAKTRRKGDPGSETSIINGTPAGSNADSVASKPKPRARRTPKNISTTQAVPSSQLSNNATKRKRGRPRKALISEDIAILTDTVDAAGAGVANSDAIQPVAEDSESLPPPIVRSNPDSSRVERSRRGIASDDTNDIIDDIARDSERTITLDNASNLQESRDTQQDLMPSATSYQEELDDDDFAVGDDYPALMEPHSDAGSDLDNTEGVPHSGQDTLAHASDFSMIAVESLPSFQASFQANRSAFPSDPAEIGDETNLIINQTLESLRNSTRTGEARRSLSQSTRSYAPGEEEQSGVQDGSVAEDSEHSHQDRSRSLRKQKSVPLSRRVFTGKAPHVDDSFSSLPDSILRAATPGRLPMKPTSTAGQQEDTGAYDDSFSEIPEAVLEAATPKPATRTGASAAESRPETVALHSQDSSVNRRTGPDFESSRLPTPENTSSSNAGSKRAPDDEAGPSTRAQEVSIPTSNSGMRSSPPIMNRPRAMDFGPSRLDQEINNTPELQESSPQLPPSAKAPTEPPRSLEPPPNSRPSLSPIVRVGRTLQNVMSDRSSPEGREGSLGSPFRGSASQDPSQPFPSDQSGQLSIPRSPTPTRPNHGISARFNVRTFNPSAPTAFPQTRRPSFARGQSPAQADVVGNVSDPFAPSARNNSRAEPSRRAPYGTNDRAPPERSRSARISPTPSSAREMPSSDDRQQEAGPDPDSRPADSLNSSAFAANRSNEDPEAAANAKAAERGMTGDREQEPEEGDTGGLLDYEEDDGDIWDIEASRPTPRKPEPAQRSSQLPDPPPRRTKILSPWRRTSRRLIYREEIASPSQIEIGESPQSEAEDAPLARPRSRISDARSILQGIHPELTLLDEFSSPQPEPEALSSQPEPEASSPRPESQEKPTEPADASEYSMLASVQQTEEQQTEEPPTTEKKAAPAKSRLFGGFDILSFFSSPATLPTKAPEAGSADVTNSTKTVTQPMFQKPPPKQAETQPPKEPQRSFWSTGLFSSIPQKEAQPSPERRTDPSSPAPPSQPDETLQDSHETSPSPAPSPSPEPNSPEPNSPESNSPRPDSPEPNSPKPNSPNSSMHNSPTHNSPELESPEPNSPEPDSPEPFDRPASPEPVSPQPSTPERQIYPPIEQKRNFTPRPGQSGSSLFRTGPSPSRSETDDGLLLPPSEDQQESSLMTDGTEYERVPPREKPSRWDRTLSPTKSCFRSPMKATTPGRVVAFRTGALSPTAEAQARIEKQHNGTNSNAISQGPVLRPVPELTQKESTASAAPQAATRKPNPPPTTANAPPAKPAVAGNSRARPASRRPSRQALAPSSRPSSREWTRDHWVRLDELLQLRWRDPLAFKQHLHQIPQTQWHRPSPSLLGKEVTAQGESLILEPWHLEVVAAFASEVGGWDDNSLAKRVFALVAGERRRQKARAARAAAGVDADAGANTGAGSNNRGRIDKGKGKVRAVA